MNAFKFNKVEKERADKFIRQHKSCRDKYPTTIGGTISYILTPTGVGTSIEIRCNICKDLINITDLNSW